MLTLAACINNLEEERNDLSFPAPLASRILDFLLTTCFKLPCRSKIPLFFYLRQSQGVNGD